MWKNCKNQNVWVSHISVVEENGYIITIKVTVCFAVSKSTCFVYGFKLNFFLCLYIWSLGFSFSKPLKLFGYILTYWLVCIWVITMYVVQLIKSNNKSFSCNQHTSLKRTAHITYDWIKCNKLNTQSIYRQSPRNQNKFMP